MTLDEIKLRLLAGQHLLTPADTQTVVKELCGVQAQFLSHALHGLSIRCTEVNTDGLIKSWTNRGTMHLFSVDDLPLFLHEGRTHFSAQWIPWNRMLTYPLIARHTLPISSWMQFPKELTNVKL